MFFSEDRDESIGYFLTKTCSSLTVHWKESSVPSLSVKPHSKEKGWEGSPALHWDSSNSHLDTACQILPEMCELYRVDRKSPAL